MFQKQINRSIKDMWSEPQLMILLHEKCCPRVISAMGSWRAFYSIAETLDFTLGEMEASVTMDPDGGKVSTGLRTWAAMVKKKTLPNM